MPDSSPLTTTDLEQMNEALKRLDEADALITRSIAAGIDMTEQKKRAMESRTQITRIKQTFFPGQ